MFSRASLKYLRNVEGLPLQPFYLPQLFQAGSGKHPGSPRFDAPFLPSYICLADAGFGCRFAHDSEPGWPCGHRHDPALSPRAGKHPSGSHSEIQRGIPQRRRSRSDQCHYISQTWKRGLMGVRWVTKRYTPVSGQNKKGVALRYPPCVCVIGNKGPRVSRSSFMKSDQLSLV